MPLQSFLVNASRPRSLALCGNGRLRCVDDTQTKSPWRDPRCGVWTAMLSSWSWPRSLRILEPTSDNLCSTSRKRFVSLSQIIQIKFIKQKTMFSRSWFLYVCPWIFREKETRFNVDKTLPFIGCRFSKPGWQNERALSFARVSSRL